MAKRKTKLGIIHVVINSNKEELGLLNKVVNKLKKAGYKTNISKSEQLCKFFFLQINKDEKKASTYNSIIGPAALASNHLRPIPVKWAFDLFDLIISKSTSEIELKMIEKISYQLFK